MKDAQKIIFVEMKDAQKIIFVVLKKKKKKNNLNKNTLTIKLL